MAELIGECGARRSAAGGAGVPVIDRSRAIIVAMRSRDDGVGPEARGVDLRHSIA